MTRDDWAAVEKALSGTYGHVVLLVDGHTVTFNRGLVSKNRLGIWTFVDGYFKGMWVIEKNGHPESQYLHRKSRYVYTAKERARMKQAGKRTLKAIGLDPDRRIDYLDPFWPSVTAIRRHYQKTFANIELVSINGVPPSEPCDGDTCA